MNFDDRLRSHLRSDASAVDVTPSGADHIVAAARRRTRRHRVVGGAGALVLVAGATFAVTTLGDDDGDRVAARDDAALDIDTDATDGGNDEEATDIDNPADTDTSPADPATTELAPEDQPIPVEPGDDPGVSQDGEIQPGDLGLLAVNDLLVVDDGFVAWGPAQEAELWFSADGDTWDPIADPRPDQNSFVGGVESDGTALYAFGGGMDPDGSVGRNQPWIARTDDRQTWQQLDLAFDLPGDGSAAVWSPNLYAMAASGNRVVVTGQAFVQLDVDALVSAAPGSYEWSIGDAGGTTDTLFVFDAETGETIEEIDLIDAGLDQATIDAVMGNARNLVAVADLGDGPSFVDVSDTAAPDAPIARLTALPDGFAGTAFDADLSSEVLLLSDDGRTWTPERISVASSAPAGAALGIVGDTVIVATAEGPLLTYQSRGPDGEWSETRIDDQLGDHDWYVTPIGDAGPSGYAAIVFATDDQDAQLDSGPAPFVVEVSADGHTARIDRGEGIITIVDDTSGDTVASFSTLSLEAPADEAPDDLPTNLRRIPGGVAVLDGDVEVARLDGIALALDAPTDAATSGLESGGLAPQSTSYLISTVDGETWTVRTGDEIDGLSDLVMVRALTVDGDDIVLAVDPVDGRGVDVLRVALTP